MQSKRSNYVKISNHNINHDFETYNIQACDNIIATLVFIFNGLATRISSPFQKNSAERKNHCEYNDHPRIQYMYNTFFYVLSFFLQENEKWKDIRNWNIGTATAPDWKSKRKRKIIYKYEPSFQRNGSYIRSY